MTKIKLFFLIILISCQQSVCGQFSCLPINDNFQFVPTPIAQTKTINWDKFPAFTLPFKIVYGGPRFGDQNQQPLQHGFSHLSTYSGADSANLPVKNRALIWYGVAYDVNMPQPWQEIRSPWANNIDRYKNKWRAEMNAYSFHFNDTKGTGSPAADILMMDIERHWEGQFTLATDLSILAQKKNVLVPNNYSLLPDAQYVTRYKRDMLNLYALPVKYLRSNGLLNKFKSIGSYADVPIRNQVLNIEGNGWSDWVSNPERLSYLMKDTLTNKLGGEYYNQLDLLSPTCYLQTEYGVNPKAKGGDYLAEFLFQIEVNKAWSAKELMPFVWLRYEDFSIPGSRFVRPFQAEAMAVFPFFAGAKGLWLWDDGNTFNENTNFNIYEYFVNGLYRLSNYKQFFEGNYEIYNPKNARDLYVDQSPVWRAVIKGDKILIAAQNPYAAENEQTKLNVSFKGWSNVISLKGNSLFLCSFNLVDVTANEPKNLNSKLQILSNPLVSNNLNFVYNASVNQKINIQLFESGGKLAFEHEKNIIVGENTYSNHIENLPKGMYFLILKTKEGNLFKKILNL